jgi:hypothetical protein
MGGLSDRWRQRFKPAEEERRLDPVAVELFRPAPNILQWIVGDRYLASVDSLEFTASYQVARDFFGLRCPRCNGGPYHGTPRDGGIGDCWGKSPEQLRAEVLLEWSPEHDEDVCPGCGATRSELVASKELADYRSMHLLAGMRSVPLDTLVHTTKGLLTLRELFTAYTDLPVGRGELAIRDLTPPSHLHIEPAPEIPCVLSERGPVRVGTCGLSGVKPIRRLVCRDGWESVTSNEHELRVVTKTGRRAWKRARDVRPGDALLVAFGHDMWGDGSLSPQAAYELGTRAEVDAPRITEVVAHAPLASSAAACIPVEVRAAKRAAVIAYLQGHADARWFCCTEQGGKRVDGSQHHRPALGFNSGSKPLVDGIRLLLANLGIRTSLVRRNRADSRQYDLSYKVYVRQDSIARWAELIGLREDPERLERIADLAAHPLKRLPDVDGPRGTASSWLDFVDRTGGLDRDPSWRKLPTRARAAVSPSLVRTYLDGLSEWELAGVTADELAKWTEFADEGWIALEVLESTEEAPTEMGDLTVLSAAGEPLDHADASYTAGGFLGHNSGKSFTGAIIMTFMEHRLLCHAHRHLTTGSPIGRPPGLSGYLGHSPATQYESTFLAASGEQSKDTVFAIYKGLRDLAPWFSSYRKWVKAEEATQSRSRAPWAYQDDLVLQIRNGHPDVRWVITSGHSNSRTQAGRTRLTVCVDEVGRMQVTGSALGADELYLTMDSSLQTARSCVRRLGLEPWVGAIISVSSPKSRFDKAYRLWKDSMRIPSMYSFRAPTWNFNPREPRENFEVAFQRDPVGAMTDFGASPPGTENPLIEDPQRFRKLAVDTKAKPACTFRTVELRQHDYRYVAAEVDHMPFAATSGTASTPRVIFGDAGESFDAFALACGYGTPVGVAPDGRPIMATVVEWVVRILPPPGYQVWFDCVVDLLREAAKKRNVRQVRFDRWQSTHLIQKIREHVADTERFSLKPEQFIAFRSDAMSGRVRLLPPLLEDAEEHVPEEDEGAGWTWKRTPPEMSPQAAGLYELLGLTRDPDTGKVTNPRKGLQRGWSSDDTAQCLVGLHTMIASRGYTEKFDDRSARAARQRAEAHAPQATVTTRYAPSVWRRMR